MFRNFYGEGNVRVLQLEENGKVLGKAPKDPPGWFWISADSYIELAKPEPEQKRERR